MPLPLSVSEAWQQRIDLSIKGCYSASLSFCLQSAYENQHVLHGTSPANGRKHLQVLKDWQRIVNQQTIRRAQLANVRKERQYRLMSRMLRDWQSHAHCFKLVRPACQPRIIPANINSLQSSDFSNLIALQHIQLALQLAISIRSTLFCRIVVIPHLINLRAKLIASIFNSWRACASRRALLRRLRSHALRRSLASSFIAWHTWSRAEAGEKAFVKAIDHRSVNVCLPLLRFHNEL